MITGVYAPSNGAIYYKGNKIVQNHPQGKMKKLYRGENPAMYAGHHVLAPTPDKITSLGIARTFQNIRQVLIRGTFLQGLTLAVN